VWIQKDEYEDVPRAQKPCPGFQSLSRWVETHKHPKSQFNLAKPAIFPIATPVLEYLVYALRGGK
jgi:hypothetical protein